MPAVLRMRHPNPGSSRGQGGDSSKDERAADVIDEPCLEQHAGEGLCSGCQELGIG